jgi:hypothetical protein
MARWSFVPLLSVTGAALLLGGCASLTSPARERPIDITRAHWIDYDGSRRGTMLLPAGARVKTCAEPAPDVAFSFLAKIDGALKLPESVDASLKAELSQQVVELAGRTQVVLFLREALFRLCEQSLNGTFDERTLVDAYSKVIDTSVKIVETARLNAEVRRSSAENENLRLRGVMPPQR